MPLMVISERLHWSIRWLALLASLLIGTVRAELLDELAVSRDGDSTVLEIRFQRPVVYQRHSPHDEGELIQIYFRPLTAISADQAREEFRRVVGEGNMPAATVTHHGRDSIGTHRLTVALAHSQRYEISQGHDQNSIRIRFLTSPASITARWCILLSRTGNAPALITALQSLPLRRVNQSNGEQWLMLGEFAELSQAAAVLHQVQAIQPNALMLERNQAGDWQPAQVPAVAQVNAVDSRPATAPLAEPAEALTSAAAVERYAEALMESALAQLTAGDLGAALETLNRLLNLPPNLQSADAQELIGLTRERLGDTDRARIEYELFLRLYPESDRRVRVEERLQKLQAPTPPPAVSTTDNAETDVSTEVYGSVLQTWFEGNSKVETETTNPLDGIIDRSSLSLQDQRSLLSSIDLTFRRRSTSTEQRWVLRDAYLASYLDDTDDRNRLYAAYWDYRNRNQGWSMRLGRQSSQVGGVLGRFDGLQANYEGYTDHKLGMVLGRVADNGQTEDNDFAGLFAEQRLFDHRFNNQFYVLQNERGGSIRTREAIGDVLSYVGDRITWYGMVDYDALFSELNIASVQGSWQYLNGGYLSWLLDQRKTPVLDLGNALIGEPVQSLAELVTLLGDDTVMQYARDRTADAKGASLSLTYPLAEHWQIGVDVRSYEIGAQPASGSLPASPGTGNVLTVGVQVIGNQLLAARDANVWSLNQIQGDRYDGWSLAYTLLWPATDALTIEPSLRYYRQQDENEITLARWTPILRLRYQIASRMMLELQYDGEQSLTESETLSDRLNRQLWSLGYVWEF